MFGRAILHKLPECIFENFEIVRENEGNFKIFKNHEGDLFQKLPEPTHFALKLIHFNSGQLRISERVITKQRATTK